MKIHSIILCENQKQNAVECALDVSESAMTELIQVNLQNKNERNKKNLKMYVKIETKINNIH